MKNAFVGMSLNHEEWTLSNHYYTGVGRCNVVVNWDSCPTSRVIVELSFKLENIIKGCPYECFKKVLACPHSVSEGLESVSSIFLFHNLFPFY